MDPVRVQRVDWGEMELLARNIRGRARRAFQSSEADAAPQSADQFPESMFCSNASLATAAQPNVIETFQQIINGLPEQIALVDENWTILAVNPAWTETAALYGYSNIAPSTNYASFCQDRAAEGRDTAAIVLDGIRQIDSGATGSFRYIYRGSGPGDGHAFQLCINRLQLGGENFATITRYDVTELVDLRGMRERFGNSVIEGQAEERRRMAREIHDSTMQLLVCLGLSLGQLKRSKRLKTNLAIIDEMEELLGDAQRELRTISYLAHPPVLGRLGLARSLRELVDGFARRTGLDISLEADGEMAFSEGTEGTVFRVIQEALSNAHRHARATQVGIGITQRRSILHVSVADNGIGMPNQPRRGVGLSSMRARLADLGGRLSIRSRDPGTVLIASLPARAELRAVGGLALPKSGPGAPSLRGCAAGATSCPHGHIDCTPAHVIAKEEWLPRVRDEQSPV